MQRLFITGGTGFFGKSFLSYRVRHPYIKWGEWVILSRTPEAFVSHYPQLVIPGISFVKGDVMDFEFPPGTSDAIIHIASPLQGAVSDKAMEQIILGGARHIVDFAKQASVNHVLFTSSGAVYGPQLSPVEEECECRPTTAYGRGKLQSERIFLDAGLNVKIARCFAFVGPYLPRDAHFAIGNFINNCLNDEPIIIQGDGTPRRSYLYADDLVEWLLKIMKVGVTGRPYNVGSSSYMSIRELAEYVRLVIGSTNEIRVMGAKNQEKPAFYVPCLDRAEKELGLKVTVGLSDAIIKSVDIK